MKREEMGSCGLIFLYLAGQKEENGGLMLRKVDSCQDILDFSEQVRVLQEGGFRRGRYRAFLHPGPQREGRENFFCDRQADSG